MEKDRSLLALVFYDTIISLLYMPFYSLFFEGWNRWNRWNSISAITINKAVIYTILLYY